MNKKIIFLACAMGIIALLAISAASAEISDVDTSDWLNITINNIDFQIPPEYDGGRNESDYYLKDNVFTFGLVTLETDKSLKNNYGYIYYFCFLQNIHFYILDHRHKLHYIHFALLHIRLEDYLISHQTFLC